MPEVSLPEAQLPLPGSPWRRRLSARVRIVAIVAAFWLAAAVIQAAHFMVTNRADYLGKNDGWVEGRLPALRGRLVSQEGIPLAWSSRRFRLEYIVPDNPEAVRSDYFVVQRQIDLSDAAPWETASRHAGTAVVLKDNLSAEEILQLSNLITRKPALRIVSRFDRESIAATSESARMIGTVQIINQVEVGISGWERDYDPRLRGRDGRFRVMVDRTGAWIPATWEEIQPPQAGDDVFVPASIRAQ